MQPSIQLSNGRYWDFTQPDPSVLDIDLIADSLSKQCRFSGHTLRFYSVAEHCWRASFIGPDDEALDRLMHDAAEALVVDMPSPMKVLLPTYRQLEEQAHLAVAIRFGLRWPQPPSVRHADLVMLATEKRDLMVESGYWSHLEGIEPLKESIRKPPAGSPFVWREAFIQRFIDLGGRS